MGYFVVHENIGTKYKVEVNICQSVYNHQNISFINFDKLLIMLINLNIIFTLYL